MCSIVLETFHSLAAYNFYWIKPSANAATSASSELYMFPGWCFSEKIGGSAAEMKVSESVFRVTLSVLLLRILFRQVLAKRSFAYFFKLLKLINAFEAWFSEIVSEGEIKSGHCWYSIGSFSNTTGCVFYGKKAFWNILYPRMLLGFLKESIFDDNPCCVTMRIPGSSNVHNLLLFSRTS